MQNIKYIKITDKGREFAQKKTKFKLAKKIIKRLIIPLAIVGALVGVPGVPYLANHIANDSFVSSHTNDAPIEQVYEAEAETYAQSPYTYDGNVKAYLEAPGIFNQTYPVMQTDNNDYYLNHDVYGNNNSKGSIYKDFRNNEGLSDDFTVIYGHNLKDDSMMGKVSEYADKEVGDKQVRNAEDSYNATNKIDYKDAYGHYEIEIFASGVYNGNLAFQNVGNFADENAYNDFINQVKAGSDIETNIVPTKGDKIVGFYTCPDTDANDYYRTSDPDNRVLVFGVAKQLEKYQELPNNLENTSHMTR